MEKHFIITGKKHMAKIHNYGIKKGYISKNSNQSTDTYRESRFWSKNRIIGSRYYQYDFYKYNTHIFKKNNFNSVLDVGCGTAQKLITFFQKISSEIAGIDQAHPISYCNNNYKFSNVTFHVDDFDNPKLNLQKKFDLIICSDVIEHVEDPEKLLAYLRKYANKRSIICVSSPERDRLRGITNFSSPHKEHVREWNARELRTFIEKSGFRVIDHRIFNALSFNFCYPTIVKYLQFKLTGKLRHNQGIYFSMKK